LRDGFVVAANTRLVGNVFDEVGQKSWSAMLDIDRDPVGVYDSYVEQARKRGVPMPKSGAIRFSSRCKPQPNRPGRTECPRLPPPCLVARAAMTCYGVGAGGPDAPLAVSISLVWGRDTRHALIDVFHTGRRDPDAELGDETVAAESGVPQPRKRAPITTPGDPFGAGNNAFQRGYRRFELERGSRVVADAPGLGLAVLRITGNATEVLSRYAAQLATPAKPPNVTVTRLPRGGTILSIEYSPEGGGAAWLSTDASHKYVKVTWNSD
jgi:hypothetical protein